MKKNLLRILIFFVTIILLGLVSIQVYWIKSAITLKEQEFDRGVNEALASVAHKLERKDAMTFFFEETIYFSGNNRTPDRSSKGNNKSNSVPLENDISRLFVEMDKEMEALTSFAGNKNNSDVPEILFDFDTIISSDDSGAGLCQNIITIQIGDSSHTISVTGNNEDMVRKSMNSKMKKIKRKRHVMNDMLLQYFSNERSIYERINNDDLNVLLTKELDNQGINTPVEYIVTDQFGRLVVKSQNFNVNNNFTANKVSLFPNDYFNETNNLFVQFPSKRSYIVKSLGVMSFSSMGLILLVSLSFAYVVQVVFKQKKLSDMKTDFINNMTHEFKTPVSTISLASEMLKDSKVREDNKNVLKYANIIYDENKRLGGQVERVLQMSVLDRGDYNLNITKLDLHNLIHKALNKISLHIEDKGVELTNELNAKQSIVEVDETHFVNIILNLLENAIKYSTEQPLIKVNTKDLDDAVMLSISDNGIGMNKEDQKRVFDKFYRVPTGNIHDVKGFGLGLSYVKSLVEAHHGKINLLSEPGSGTTIEIIIPHHQYS